MIGISSDNPELMCPDCKRIMMRMDHYEGAIDAYGAEAAGGGFLPVNRGIIGFLLLDGLLNILFAWRHRAKPRNLCAQILPQYPNTLICANCFFCL